VLLTGEVPDEASKATAEREVRAVEGVVSVTNELEVAGLSSYTSRSSDAIITTKVKASLVDMKDRLGQFLQGRHRTRRGLPDGPRDPARRPDRRRRGARRQRRDQGRQGVRVHQRRRRKSHQPARRPAAASRQ
jgi:hypothetical protein